MSLQANVTRAFAYLEAAHLEAVSLTGENAELSLALDDLKQQTLDALVMARPFYGLQPTPTPQETAVTA